VRKNPWVFPILNLRPTLAGTVNRRTPVSDYTLSATVARRGRVRGISWGSGDDLSEEVGGVRVIIASGGVGVQGEAPGASPGVGEVVREL
jgi:hypothetical protein